MNNWQPSTLTWSFSQKAQFDSCRRGYFYHRFWGQDAKLKWRVFEMRNLSTLTMLLGEVVHEVISHALASSKLGIKIDSTTAKRTANRHNAEALRGIGAKAVARRQASGRSSKPSQITSLLEHYYSFSNMNERAREAQRTAWTSIENLLRSEIWREIVDIDPENLDIS